MLADADAAQRRRLRQLLERTVHTNDVLAKCLADSALRHLLPGPDGAVVGAKAAATAADVDVDCSSEYPRTRKSLELRRREREEVTDSGTPGQCCRTSSAANWCSG